MFEKSPVGIKDFYSAPPNDEFIAALHAKGFEFIGYILKPAPRKNSRAARYPSKYPGTLRMKMSSDDCTQVYHIGVEHGVEVAIGGWRSYA
jgi:hypothetical protein